MMNPGLTCDNCSKPVERVDEQSWICVPCRRSFFWHEPITDAELDPILYREFAQHTIKKEAS